MSQSATGTATVTGTVGVSSLPGDTYSAKTADATASGDNTIHDPTAGKAVRLYYICLSAADTNSAPVTVVVKLGASSLYKLSMAPGMAWARNIGAGRRYLQGAADGLVVVNLSATQTVSVSIEYEEV